jgi:hypothetical protein
MVTVSRNSDFLKIFDNCCGFSVFRDQRDPSSVIRLRPDDTIMSNGAVLLKNEAKADLRDAEVAKDELTKKMAKEALRIFPENSQSIIGMTTFPERIHLYSIDYDLTHSNFNSTLLKAFDMRQLNERVNFVQDMFKLAQWMSTVHRAQSPFHLIHGVRQETPNGHHITWTKDGICKELKMHGTYSTRHGELVMKEKLRRIKQVYEARFQNVEWGTVKPPNFVMVARVGFMLSTALSADMINKEQAISDIRKGGLQFLTLYSY